VLGGEAGIFDGHFPPTEVDQFGAEAAMHGVEGRFAEFGSGGRRHGNPRRG
jgi:hypothetical protein